MNDNYESAFVYIDRILDSKEPIYVRNVFSKRGIVVVTLNDGNRTHREPIPNTKYPICLSNKATPDMIRNSKSLRQLLDKGVLELVPHKVAEKELSNPNVRQALADAYERISPSSSGVKANRTPTNQDNEDFDAPSVDDSDVEHNASLSNSDDDVGFERENDPETEGVAIRVVTLVESLLSRDMKSRQVKSELMSMELSSEDLSYVIDKTTGIVQRYAKEQLASSSLGADGGGYVENIS